MAVKQKIDDSEYMDKYKEACDKMEIKVAERVRGECRVFYSAYDSDEDGIPVDNLDEIALVGKIAVICNWPSVIDTEKVLTSEILKSPTWLDLTVISNDLINETCDYHHRFFEGYHIIGETHGGVMLIDLHMGS